MNIITFQVSNGIKQNNLDEWPSSPSHRLQLALPILYGNGRDIFLRRAGKR